MTRQTVRTVLAAGVASLRDGGIDGPERDGRLLMAAAVGIAPDRLMLHLDDPLTEEAEGSFRTRLQSRLDRAPVSRILGERLFWGRRFRVTEATLDPRPETETLVALALSEPFSKVLDLGTGSGCILVSLLADRPAASGIGTDISAAALLVAGENAATHGVSDRIVLPMSDWFADVGGRYDLIVSNPPYIAASEMDRLAPEVKDWEPRIALTDEADGLSAYRVIVAGAPQYLSPGGRLLVEIGPTQGSAVSELFQAAGLEDVAVHPDLDGRERVVSARQPSV